MPYGEKTRTERFQENARLNGLLSELKLLLEPVQKKLEPGSPEYPVGCIIGNPRSGTTLLLQWIASLGPFSYPTNLLTRFAYAPYIGALIQKMLFDPEYDYQGDFQDIQSGINYSSDLGKSSGALATNEFQHFFRNYMPNFDLEQLDHNALNSVDYCGILHGLASVEKAFGKPFVTKANILQYNIPFFTEHIPGLFWIHIVRDPIQVMQSILIGREQYFGNRETWWSVKPKEYERLSNMDIYHQVAGQVFFTEEAIMNSLENIPESHWTRIIYEEFCSDPDAVYKLLCAKYAALGCDLPEEYSGTKAFEVKNEIRLPPVDFDALQAAYHAFQSGLFGDR